MVKRVFLIMTAVVLLLSLACAKYKVEKPEGFAGIRESGIYKAISPEGLIYRVRYVKNYPEKELVFWGKALKNHLLKEGYNFLKEEEFTTVSRPGKLYEWGAPYGNEDYIYLTAIAVFGKEIVIAEAAGEYTLYKGYRKALLNSLSTIKKRF